MYRKAIKFTDYNGEQREEVWYFNISKAELMKKQFSIEGGFDGLLKRLGETQDMNQAFEIFDMFIRESVGKKALDGRRFEKSEEIVKEFTESEAYSEFLMEMGTDANAAAEFIKGIMPNTDEIEKQLAKAQQDSGNKVVAIDSKPTAG